MNSDAKFWIILLILPSAISYGQVSSSSGIENETGAKKEFSGFIRGGLYTGFDQNDKDKPYVSSAFSDLGLKIGIENGINFKADADLRFLYGAEFLEPVHRFDIREAYVVVNGKKWNLAAGQKIIKWGRADFTNPTSRLNPQNMINRSPDREDMDMGNLLSSFDWYPSEHISIGVVVVPFYRSSVLIIDPVPLPDNVTIKQLNTLITGKEMFSYAFKTDLHLKGIDLGVSYFDGYDPMPGIAFSVFSLDMSGPLPVSSTELTVKPYKTRVAGIDFETSAGSIGIRGEAALSKPYLSSEMFEYVPLPELKWVTGADWSSGVWRVTAEYSGKRISGFTPVTADPVIGTEPDYSKLAAMFSVPGFNPEDYVRQQVGAFNRLYNYQLKKYYHSAAFRIESELDYGKILPSVFVMYNFSARDLLTVPEIKFKPSDGLTITAGAEFYSGRRNSLFDLIDGFMNSFYVALRADF
jgi:hypothetical protein